MERSWRMAPLLAGLLALAVAALGCATPRQGPTARVGAALSLTGAARMIGTAQRSGIKLAQDEINASHTLGDMRVDVIVDDDRSDRDQAASVFHHFIEDSHVVALMGPTLSDTALSVDPLAQQAGVPLLAISNSSSGLTEIGDFIFRDSLSESQLTPRVVEAVQSRFHIRRAALLYSDTDPNRAGSYGFKSVLQNAGVQICSEQSFTREQTDVTSQLEAIAQTQPDALFVTAPSSAAATILVQARQAGITGIPIVGSNAFNSDAVLKDAGAAAEGLVVGSAWTMSAPSARNQQFIQAYRARYGVDPDQVAAQAYSGVYILAAALQAAHTATDARALRDALVQTQNVPTPLGAFSFDASHEPDYAATVQIVRSGRFQPF